MLIAAIVMATGSAMATPVPPVPDAASTSMMLSGALISLAAVKRFINR